ncbi:MAG: protease inhibitor I42 family protein [Christensenellaceae bacterium]
MKKKISVITALAITFLFLMIGCAQGSKNYTVELDGNATTGYSWQYSMSKDGIVKEVSKDYIQDEVKEQKEGEPPLVGMGGKYTFVFEGVSEGEVELNFIYTQEWDKETEPASTAKIVLSVDKNGMVTETRKEIVSN